MNAETTYSAAIDADAAYSAELHRVFGKDAGDARYDARGESTPELRRLSDAKLAADAAHRVNYDRHLAPHIVAVTFDPDGGEHPCHDITDERYHTAPWYWCAGMTGPSIADLADRLWAAWDAPSEPMTDFDERRALEAMRP